MIHSCMDGIKNKIALPDPVEINLYTAEREVLERYDSLPDTLEEAKEIAERSDFIRAHLPQTIIDSYIKR